MNRYRDVKLDAGTIEKILKNLCITLKANNIDYMCKFAIHSICEIKCGKYYISSPLIKTTELLFRVTDDKGYLLGLFDKNHLLKLLKESKTQLYEIWAEGYADNGGRCGAILLGRMQGENFKDACKNLAKKDAEFKYYFDEQRMTYWGCRLFDNQIDAMESFG